MAIKLDDSADLAHKALNALVFALLGAGVGWAAQALTLSGRVTAIEAGMERLEAQIGRLLQQRGLSAPPMAPSGTPILYGDAGRCR